MNIGQRLAAIQNLQASHDLIASLEEAKASLEQLIDEMPHAVLVFDGQGHVYKANGEACHLLAVDSESYLGRRIFELFDRESGFLLKKILSEVQQEPLLFEHGYAFELAVQTRRGQTLPYAWTLRALAPRSYERVPLLLLSGRNLADVKSFDLELSRIYSSISLGIMTIDGAGFIEPHYSRYCEYLLQHPHISGTHNGFAKLSYEDLLFKPSRLKPQEQEAVQLIRRALGESEFWFESTKAHFPQLIERPIDGGRTLWLKLDYFPIVRDGIVDKILLILENRTEIVNERVERSLWIQRNEALVRRILEVQNSQLVTADIKNLVQLLDSSLDPFDAKIFRQHLERLRDRASEQGLMTLKELSDSCLLRQARLEKPGRADALRDYAPLRDEAIELLRIHNLLRGKLAREDESYEGLQAIEHGLDQALAQLKPNSWKTAQSIMQDLKQQITRMQQAQKCK